MGATSLDLSQIKTDVLSAASTFRTLIGLGNVNNTADLDKPISTATQAALDLKANSSSLANYLPLAGGTMAGKITATATGQWNTGGIGNGRNGIDFFNGILTYLNNAGTTLYPSYFTVNGGIPRLKLSSHTLLGWGSVTDAGADANVDLVLSRDTADTLALIRGTNAQRFNLYGTYTDANNYRRFYITSTTGGAFTLGVEGLGTGASGNTLTIANAVTFGGSIIGTQIITNTNGFQTPIGGNGYAFNSGGYFICSSNGVFKFSNWADNDFGRLQLGGTTSSFPSIKRNGTAINFRLADDSADASITSGPIQASTVASTNKGLIVRGSAAQSANLVEVQDVSQNVLASIDKDGDVVANSGSFHTVQLTSDAPRQSGVLFLDNNKLLTTSTNFIHDNSNPASPKLVFKASGNATPDISLNVLTSASGSSSGVQTLSFEGSAGQLFSVSDVLNSGTIFGVNDISGLPLLEVDATGLVSLARFGTGINAHRTINALQGISGTNGTFSGTVTAPNILGSSNLIYVGQNQTFSWEYDSTNSNPALRFTWGGAATTLWGSSSAVNISVQGTNGFRVAAGTTNLAGTLGLGSVSSPNIFLRSDSSNTLDIRNAANAQRINIYNTFTDASNYERLRLEWSSNSVKIGTEAAGTGTVRTLEFWAGTMAFFFGTGNVSFLRSLQSDTNNTVDVGANNRRFRTLMLGTSIDNLGFEQFTEMTPPTTPAANSCRIYAKDNGSGKTQLVVLMPDGVETVLATQT